MLQLAIHLPAFGRVFRGQGRTADEITQSHVRSILRNAPPQQGQHFRGAMFAVDRGSAQFQNAGTQGLIRRQIEFLLGVVPVMPRCRLPGLHSIGTYNPAPGIVFPLVLDNQVLAHLVELVGIESRLVRALQPLAQFNIENPEAKRQAAIRSSLDSAKRRRYRPTWA